MLVVLQMPQICPLSCSVSREADYCGCFTFLLGSANGRLWPVAREGGERGQSIWFPSSSLRAHSAGTTGSGNITATQEGNRFPLSLVCVLPTLCWFP